MYTPPISSKKQETTQNPRDSRIDCLIDFANRNDSYTPKDFILFAGRTARSFLERVPGLNNLASRAYREFTQGNLMFPGYFFAGATVNRFGSQKEYEGLLDMFGQTIPGTIMGAGMGTVPALIPLLFTSEATLDKYMPVAMMIGAAVPLATNVASTIHEATRILKRTIDYEKPMIIDAQKK